MEEIKKYLSNADTNYSASFKRKVKIQRGAVIIVLTALTVVLYIFRLRLPMLPRMFVTELSALPELLLTFAYGPLCGIAACLIKNVVHIFMTGNSFIPDTANFITESLLLLVTGILFMQKMEADADEAEEKIGRRQRIKHMLSAFAVGAAVALAAQFIITVLYIYPSLIENYDKIYSPQVLLESYRNFISGIQAHLPSFAADWIPSIRHLWQGVLMINLPITLLKLCASAVPAVLLYTILLPQLYVRIPKIDNPLR